MNYKDILEFIRTKVEEKRKIREMHNRLLVSIDKRKICNKKTDIVIDGYPRSGNSYCVHLVEMQNPNLSISHHTHLPNNIKLAILLKKPIIVVIRSPQEAILSNLIYSDNDLGKLCDDYLEYYELIFRFRYRVNIVIFEDVIQNEKLLYEAVELETGKKINKETTTAEMEERTRNKHKREMNQSLITIKSGMPSVKRNEVKKKLAPKVKRFLTQRNDVVEIHKKVTDFVNKSKRD
ncbi:hypothetical protein RN22_06395 [Grimontia sp. AD028]|uniref:hypothetical protein n=1 Tax=Grimontia sp. AD028 TaxID=1581149 RepID=UPI00061ADE1C|nr:hypothetical protein [Grimontia sp. AD028]KKD61344.1 hypothetical protein RN22_06395 [Grimontia sp. AD028]